MHPDLRKFYDDLDYKNRILFLSSSHDTLETLMETAAELKAIAFILDEMEAARVPENDPQRITANDMRDKITLRLLSAARETFTTLLYSHGEQLMSTDFLMQFTDNGYNGETLRKKCEQPFSACSSRLLMIPRRTGTSS